MSENTGDLLEVAIKNPTLVEGKQKRMKPRKPIIIRKHPSQVQSAKPKV